MKRNESTLDMIIRIVLGLVLIGLAFYGTLGIWAYIVGGIVAVTGLIGYCPLYQLLGVSTKKD